MVKAVSTLSMPRCGPHQEPLNPDPNDFRHGRLGCFLTSAARRRRYISSRAAVAGGLRPPVPGGVASRLLKRTCDGTVVVGLRVTGRCRRGCRRRRSTTRPAVCPGRTHRHNHPALRPVLRGPREQRSGRCSPRRAGLLRRAGRKAQGFQIRQAVTGLRGGGIDRNQSQRNARQTSDGGMTIDPSHGIFPFVEVGLK